MAPIVYGTNLDRWDLIRLTWTEQPAHRLGLPKRPQASQSTMSALYSNTRSITGRKHRGLVQIPRLAIVDALRSMDEDIHAICSLMGPSARCLRGTQTMAPIAATYESAFFNLDTYRRKRLCLD